MIVSTEEAGEVPSVERTTVRTDRLLKVTRRPCKRERATLGRTLPATNEIVT